MKITLVQHPSLAPARKTRRSLGLTALLSCGLFVICSTAQAQSPTPVCNTYTDVWGQPAAVVTTTGTVSDEQAGYMVAAIADESGYLEVKAFSNKCKELGHVHSDITIGAPINAVAAADLDSSQIVTAVVDQAGTLQLRTWSVGGTAGIAPLNAGYLSSMNTANPVGNMPYLGITALSATEVVTAYQDYLGNLLLQQWNIPSGGVPAPVGNPLNLAGAIKTLCAATPGFPNPDFGEPSKIAIATVDSSLGMFVTAASDIFGNFYLDVWTLGNDGTFGTGGQVCRPGLENGEYPGLAVAAGYGQVFPKTGKLRTAETQRYAVTPLINSSEYFEVLYWDISSTGAISKTADITDTDAETALPTASAGAMLPTGVPISAFLQQSGDSYYVNVGWYGYTGESTADATNITATNQAGVWSVAAAEAGASFPEPPLEWWPGTAYFVTGVVTANNGKPPAFATKTSRANEGIFKLNLWSYPVVTFF